MKWDVASDNTRVTRLETRGVIIYRSTWRRPIVVRMISMRLSIHVPLNMCLTGRMSCRPWWRCWLCCVDKRHAHQHWSRHSSNRRWSEPPLRQRERWAAILPVPRQRVDSTLRRHRQHWLRTHHQRTVIPGWG